MSFPAFALSECGEIRKISFRACYFSDANRCSSMLIAPRHAVSGCSRPQPLWIDDNLHWIELNPSWLMKDRRLSDDEVAGRESVVEYQC